MAGLLAASVVPPTLACGPGALGVSRVIEIGGAPQVGLKSFPRTLDLADHEVVLTFDDGPSAKTAQVLDALAAQCAKATFFVIGKNALDLPDTVRREIAEGHTVGSHSFSHPWRMLRGIDQARAVKEIDEGDAALQKASDGKASHFFRFPGFGDTPALLEAARQRGMPVFGADLWASDWNRMTPNHELRLLMGRLRRAGSGIVLLHDIHKQTADMIPALLVALKAQGFKLVHLVPGAKSPALREAPAGWVSKTEEILHDPHFSAPGGAPKTLMAPN
jgi:peptidoglycan/xylan/chitin deacetylase (PgdA/CDA1 family)